MKKFVITALFISLALGAIAQCVPSNSPTKPSSEQNRSSTHPLNSHHSRSMPSTWSVRLSTQLADRGTAPSADTQPSVAVTTQPAPSPPPAVSAPVASVPSSAPVSTPVGGSGDVPDATQMAAWSRVNVCEEGGDWSVDGSSYSGGLGWLHATWAMFRSPDDPSDMAYATPEQQVAAAVQFAVHYYGNPYWAPDQSGCGGGY